MNNQESQAIEGKSGQEPTEERTIATACKAIKDALLASGWMFADYQPQMTGEELLSFTGKNDEMLQVIVTLEEAEEELTSDDRLNQAA